MSEENKAEMVTADTEMVEDKQTPEVAAVQAELEDARKALKKANREAAERRKQLEAFEAAEAERKQAEMSEQEKLQAKVAEMETRAKEAEARLDLMHKRNAFYSAAAQAEFTWASEQARQDAALLLDFSELDDGDMEQAVKDLKEARPYLFAQPTMPDTDSTKRGKGTKQDADEAKVQDAARRFGIRYVPKE